MKILQVKESRDNHLESNQRMYINDLRSQRSFYEPENGNMPKNICGSLFSILGAAVGGVWYMGLFLAKVFLNMVGIRWLNICHLIQYGLQKRNDLREKKLRWRLSLILLEGLVNHYSLYINDPNQLHRLRQDEEASNHKANETKEKDDESRKVESPFLIPARLGVAEVADAILYKFPVATFDLDSESKNAALLACEKKNVGFFEIILDKYPKTMKQMLMQLDKQGNSALHLAAKFQPHMVSHSPEPASYLLAEYRWYKRVKEIMS